ncbi:hypothetical protein JCM11251_006759 [Rhodosporidiobolus azoricus]
MAGGLSGLYGSKHTVAAPGPAATGPITSSGQPIFLPNLAHNNKSLYYVKSTTALVAGATAGLLGLTNLRGFAFFLFTSLAVGLAFTAANCAGKPGRFFAKASEPVLAGTIGNLFSYVLAWTFFYSIVYIYD